MAPDAVILADQGMGAFIGGPLILAIVEANDGNILRFSTPTRDVITLAALLAGAFVATVFALFLQWICEPCATPPNESDKN